MTIRKSAILIVVLIMVFPLLAGCGGGGTSNPYSLDGHWDGEFNIDGVNLLFDMSIDEDRVGNFSGVGRLFWGDLSNGFDSWGTRSGDYVSMTAREDGDDYYLYMEGTVNPVSRTLTGTAEYDHPLDGWTGTFQMWK
jgi:hypothetical protein